MAVAHERAQIVEVNLNQAGPREQLPDAAHALDQQAAGDAERVEHARVFVNELERFLARQADHAVGDGFQLLQALLRLLLAAVAFAFKRQRHKREHQRAGFLRGAREHRADAAARAAAEAGNDENHVRAVAGGFERGKLFLGDGACRVRDRRRCRGRATIWFRDEFSRVAAEAASDCRVGVDGHEARAGKFSAFSVSSRADARAADAEDFDRAGLVAIRVSAAGVSVLVFMAN